MTQILAWSLITMGVISLVLLVLLVRQTQITARLKHEEGLRDEELAHLVRRRLPALASRRTGLPEQDPGPATARFAGTGFDVRVEEVMDAFRGVSVQAKERAEESAENALRGVADRLLTLVYQLQQQIEDMEHEHEDPEVLGSLLPIDHKAQSLARWLFSLRVLTGSAPGRQRPTTPLYDVLRGALSTAPDYQRVRLLDRPRVAVRTQAVEPLIQLFGHLLENAVALSPSSSVVEVSTMRVANGLSVCVEDGGRGISDHELARIQALAAGEVNAGVGDLGDPPRIGYAFTGRIVQRHALRIVIDRRSRLAGVRVTVTIPTQLLTDAPEDEAPASRTGAHRAPSVPLPRDADAEPVHPPGLPAAREEPAVHQRAAPEEPAVPADPAPNVPEPSDAARAPHEPASPAPATAPREESRPEPERDPPPDQAGHEQAAPDRRTRHGLPVRKRGAAVGSSPAPLPPATAPRVDPSSAGARMGAWQNAPRPKSGAADGDPHVE